MHPAVHALLAQVHCSLPAKGTSGQKWLHGKALSPLWVVDGAQAWAVGTPEDGARRQRLGPAYMDSHRRGLAPFHRAATFPHRSPTWATGDEHSCGTRGTQPVWWDKFLAKAVEKQWGNYPCQASGAVKYVSTSHNLK